MTGLSIHTPTGERRHGAATQPSIDTAASPAPSSGRGGMHPGPGCEYAHGVFEFWLHPTRYRTRVCEKGDACTRRICFFAHIPEQLRSEVFHDCFRCGIDRCVAKPMRIETPTLPAANLPSVAVPVPLAALSTANLPALALPTMGAPSSSKDGKDEERGKGEGMESSSTSLNLVG